MNIIRYFMIVGLLLALPHLQPSADMVSWVDEDSVRHFSNSGGPKKDAKIEEMEEYIADPSNAQKESEAGKRYRDLEERRYKAIMKKQNEDVKRQFEREQREHDEEVRKREEMHDKLAKDKAKACTKMKKELEALRRSGWKNYASPRAEQISCPDRVWADSYGRVQDNVKECNQRRNRYRKSDFERAVRQKEFECKLSCQ